MMPLVSVMIAWASEMPGVNAPPTVVYAPNFSTSLLLNGLTAIDSSLCLRGFLPRILEMLDRILGIAGSITPVERPLGLRNLLRVAAAIPCGLDGFLRELAIDGDQQVDRPL